MIREVIRFQPDTSGLGDAITGQRVAYQRVSSLDQRVDRQLDGITVERTLTALDPTEAPGKWGLAP